MTEQEKQQLLLSDLSSRLVYGIYVKDKYNDKVIYDLDYHPNLYDCIPYLRPLSSITKEEEKELRILTGAKVLYGHIVFPTTDSFGEDNFISEECWATVFDWLNKYHFDYRGLIEKGLSLKAPEGMYK